MSRVDGFYHPRHMASVATNHTIDARISVRIARRVTDGDIPAPGVVVPLAMAGYLLAKHIHTH
jgi:hypothetical protein